MNEVKNFYETVMSCCATVVDWATLNKINDKAKNFLVYFGNYLDDDKANAFALFGVLGGARYCVKIR